MKLAAAAEYGKNSMDDRYERPQPLFAAAFCVPDPGPRRHVELARGAARLTA